MTRDQIRELVEHHTAIGALDELRDQLRTGSASELGQGQYRAGEATWLYTRRRESATAGGVDCSGFGELLDQLRREPTDSVVLLFHFKTADRLFTVLTSDEGRLLGCVRAMPVDWGPAVA